MNRKSYFDYLDLSYDSDKHFNSRISKAADEASASVDWETIRMFLRAKLPLPPRLQKLYQRYLDERGII